MKIIFKIFIIVTHFINKSNKSSFLVKGIKSKYEI